MRIDWPILATLFRTELRMAFRDRRILFTAVVLPMVLMPLMFLGSNWSLKKRKQTVSTMTVTYAVTGSQADRVRALMKDVASHARASGNTNQVFAEVPCPDPRAALAAGTVTTIIEAITGKEATNSPLPGARNATNNFSDSVHPDSLVLRLVMRADRDVSSSAANRLGDGLESARDRARSNLLSHAGWPLTMDQIARVEPVDIATKGQVAGLALGRLMPLLLLLFVLSGGAVVAMDLLAGEKERGTLETLLTTGAGRLEIILAKHLTVFAVGIIIAFLQSANLLLYAGFKLLPLPGSFAAAVTPSLALLLLLLFLPVAAVAASVLLLVSGRAKTYREAQLYFFPVFLVGMVPALAAFLPSLELHSAIVLVPVAGLAVAIREVMVGVFDWPYLLLAWLDTTAFAAWILWHALKSLSAEKLVTAADTEAADLSAARRCSSGTCGAGMRSCGRCW